MFWQPSAEALHMFLFLCFPPFLLDSSPSPDSFSFLDHHLTRMDTGLKRYMRSTLCEAHMKNNIQPQRDDQIYWVTNIGCLGRCNCRLRIKIYIHINCAGKIFSVFMWTAKINTWTEMNALYMHLKTCKNNHILFCIRLQSVARMYIYKYVWISLCMYVCVSM